MPDPRNQTITTTSGKPFTSKEHGALARLIMHRFGDDLASATAAWRRMLGNGATESDFAQILTWDETPDFKPPDVSIDTLVNFHHNLRQITVATIHRRLAELNPFGVVAEVQIVSLANDCLTGYVKVDSREHGRVTHRFWIQSRDSSYEVRAFSKVRRFKFWPGRPPARESDPNIFSGHA